MPDIFQIFAGKSYVTKFCAQQVFGIVEPAQTHLMAYAKGLSSGEWERNPHLQAEVVSDVDVAFAPIDHNSDYESWLQASDHKCDGIVYNAAEHIVVFVELKDRKLTNVNIDAVAAACVDDSTRLQLDEALRDLWLPKAVIQLAETVRRFGQSNPGECNVLCSVHWACVANRQCGYGVEFSSAAVKECFHKITGFNLLVNTCIRIQRPPSPITFRLLNDRLIREITE